MSNINYYYYQLLLLLLLTNPDSGLLLCQYLNVMYCFYFSVPSVWAKMPSTIPTGTSMVSSSFSIYGKGASSVLV